MANTCNSHSIARTKIPQGFLSGPVARDIMKLLITALLIVGLLATGIVLADTENVTITSKSFNAANGGSAPYFYGMLIDNQSTIFFTPGNGAQRATVEWLNRIPLNTSVRLEHSNYVISSAWNITNLSSPVEL